MTNKEKKDLFESAGFEKEFGYDGNDLGAVINKEAKTTTFKVWAPTATQVDLNLYREGDVAEKRVLSTNKLVRKKKGVWEIVKQENLDGMYYTYSVTVDGQTKETADIYAKACGVNGRRSMVIDLDRTNPNGWNVDAPVSDRKDAGAIYELHIKDFSYSGTSGVSDQNRGKYLAFTETDSVAMQHLISLGISYVHLLPFYDYGSVDEAAADEEQFNWGYDPLNYLIPEGSYSSDAFHGEIRIRETKEMIMALHKAGIGVVMDVVFNHTYNTDSWFERTVPGYYYRMDETGKLTNGSGCGNDTASERIMFRKYMKDAVRYLLTEYHLDGLRFDLMGLHDVQTMNEIRQMVNEFPNGERILIYGEPWSAGESGFRNGTVPAVRSNIEQMDEGIAIFCDATRDSIKGSVFSAREPGYANTSDNERRIALTQSIKNSICAWQRVEKPEDWNGVEAFFPKSPRQIISYVSSHDNYTLWDKLLFTSCGEPDFEAIPDQEILQINKFIAGIVYTGMGQPFMQAGEEFARTKSGAADSYNLFPSLNCLDYERKDLLMDLVEYYRNIISFRRSKSVFGKDMEEAVERICFWDVDEPLVVYELDDLVICYNPLPYERRITLPKNDYIYISNGMNFIQTEVTGNEVVLMPKTVTILQRR